MLRNETEVLKPAEIQVQLPPDYVCMVLGDGTADPDGSKGFFTHLAKMLGQVGKAQTTVCYFPLFCRQDLNNDGYSDNPMATVLSGSWTLHP